MVHRIYTERKDDHNPEVLALMAEFKLNKIRILNRYDVQGLSDSEFSMCKNSIFSEPFTDKIFSGLPQADKVLAVEFLPGQYDQRADAAEQCAGLLLGFRPVVKTAKVYLFYGEIQDFDAVKKFLINPVEAREASLEERDSLEADYPDPEGVAVVEDVMAVRGLAMSADDLVCVKRYFGEEGRIPTAAEIKIPPGGYLGGRKIALRQRIKLSAMVGRF